jgi:hypothetical protein
MGLQQRNLFETSESVMSIAAMHVNEELLDESEGLYGMIKSIYDYYSNEVDGKL